MIQALKINQGTKFGTLKKPMFSLGADHLNRRGGRGVGDFEKKFPASACRKKKIACSTNVIESVWEKREKNILPTRLLEKKILDD